jgi:anti-sigma B factor antagonist
MNITERTLAGVTILDLDGKLVMGVDKQVKQRVAAAVEAGGRKLILNLAGVPYIDSSGLGEVVACYANTRRLGGEVKLLHLNSHVQNLLVITKLITIFETFSSEPEAVASFAAPPAGATDAAAGTGG